VIPFVDVVGSAGMLLPAQYGPKVPNDGVAAGVMMMVFVTVEAH
jgi:hypothetical protein